MLSPNLSVREGMKHLQLCVIDNAQNKKFISILHEKLDAQYFRIDPKYLDVAYLLTDTIQISKI